MVLWHYKTEVTSPDAGSGSLTNWQNKLIKVRGEVSSEVIKFFLKIFS